MKLIKLITAAALTLGAAGYSTYAIPTLVTSVTQGGVDNSQVTINIQGFAGLPLGSIPIDFGVDGTHYDYFPGTLANSVQRVTAVDNILSTVGTHVPFGIYEYLGSDFTVFGDSYTLVPPTDGIYDSDPKVPDTGSTCALLGTAFAAFLSVKRSKV